jgi:hypothetical protein
MLGDSGISGRHDAGFGGDTAFHSGVMKCDESGEKASHGKI